jgi:hypothetical protein
VVGLGIAAGGDARNPRGGQCRCRTARPRSGPGPAHYGRLNGLLSVPALLATALAPWAGAALAQALGSYPAVFLVLAATAALAAGSVPSPGPTRP